MQLAYVGKKILCAILGFALALTLVACKNSSSVTQGAPVDKVLLQGFGQSSQTKCLELLRLDSGATGELAYTPSAEGYSKKYEWCGYSLDTDLAFYNDMPTAIQARMKLEKDADIGAIVSACLEALKGQLGEPVSVTRGSASESNTVEYAEQDEDDAVQWIVEQTEGGSYIDFSYLLTDYLEEGANEQKYTLLFTVMRSEQNSEDVFLGFLVQNLNNR